MGCGSSDPASGIQAQQQAQQALTNQAVGQINQAFAGFTPQWYQGVSNAYTNWALPQLQQQYQNANNQLGYKLASQGLTNSSAADQARNALSASMQQGQNTIGNQATTQAQQLQQQVGQEKSNLIGQAQTATNPSSIATQALTTASGFQQPSSFAPIGNLFSQFGQEYLANQTANTYGQFLNQYLNGFTNPAVFGAGSGTSFGLPSNLY